MINTMKILKPKLANKILAVFVFIFGIICIQLSVYSTAYAADEVTCDKTFLNIPAWYNGLTKNDKNCTLKSIGDGGVSTRVYISQLIANITSILSGLFFVICVIYVMYGGFRLITGGSNPDAVKKGRSTISNGLIGAVIGLSGSAIVTAIREVYISAGGDSGTETTFLYKLLGLATTVASWVTVLMLVLAGINFIIGGSSPDSVQKARRRLIYAAVGLAVVVSSISITRFLFGKVL